MRSGLFAFLFACSITLGLPAEESGFPIPVRKVVLYKSGVGYFVHEGQISGSQSIEIPLSSAQLDDVLKSLTVLDLNGGRIGVVTYESTAPVAKQMGDLPIDLGPAATVVDALNRLRGADVVMQLPGEKLEGRIVGAELRRAGDSGGSETVVVSLFIPPADLRLVVLDQVGSLTFADSALASDIGRYLELEGSKNERSLRRLRFQAEGTGQRNLVVSYTTEAPIWKATYRVVLRAAQKAFLQGWAVVDNTTPIDWTDVELSLVSGAPVSFVQRLSQPVYANRPVVPLPQGVRVAPTTHEGTMEDLAPRELQASAGSGLSAELLPGSVPSKRMAMAAAPSPAPMASFNDAFETTSLPAAEAGSLAEQFEYRIKEPLTINRNQSALLPVLQTSVTADKVSVYNGGGDGPNPRLAVWLQNASGLTLDGGSFSIVDDGAFAGEGIFETIQPDERRLLSYAIDLAVEISTRSGTEAAKVEWASIQDGILRFESRLTEKHTYLIRNNAAQAREIMIEHPVQPGWSLAGQVKPVETTNSYYRFKLSVEPLKTATLEVTEERPDESIFRLTDLSSDQLEIWIRDRSLGSQVQAALQRLAAQQAQIADLERQVASLAGQENDIVRDQARVRDNLGRLSRTAEEAELRQRYLDQLSTQEDRLEQIRNQRTGIEEQLRRAQEALAEMIRALNIGRSVG